MTSDLAPPDDDTPARLFVAVVPPPVVLDHLERWLVDVRSGLTRVGVGEEGLRWTTRPQWHVTLRFLGDAPLQAAAEAFGAVTAAAADAEVSCPLRQLGRGVLCLPVRGLDDLAAAVAAATGHVGRPAERRPFRGHLTLARARPGRRSPGMRRVLASAPTVTFDERFPVGEIQLMRSTLRPSGALYDVVARCALPP